MASKHKKTFLWSFDLVSHHQLVLKVSTEYSSHKPCSIQSVKVSLSPSKLGTKVEELKLENCSCKKSEVDMQKKLAKEKVLLKILAF